MRKFKHFKLELRYWPEAKELMLVVPKYLERDETFQAFLAITKRSVVKPWYRDSRDGKLFCRISFNVKKI